MSAADWIIILQWFFLLYFIGMNCGYILLNLLSIGTLKNYMEAKDLGDLPRAYSGYEPPISVLVPAYNEEAAIAGLVRSLLQLEYTEFEVIVINDGSKDDTLATLQREFSLLVFPEAYWQRIKGPGVRAIYRSSVNPSLRVIDKENGGKADALNAGINASRYPLFCAVDTDSILQRDSLLRMAQPFVENPDTVAVGSMVRIANGCEVREGFLADIGLPRNRLALMQIVERLRTLLFGRLGWSFFNAVLIISDALTLFRKESVVEAGGYRVDAIDEDMELIVRLHRLLRLRGARYQITYVPDTICWTRVPENLSTLKRHRSRWQHGLVDSLALNLPLLFHRKGGMVSWLAFPFITLFEWLGPVIEVTGYLFMISAFALGLISVPAFAIFLLVAIGFGMLLSMSSLALEELSIHLYPRPRQLAVLLAAAFLENLGYRQLVALWRSLGLMQRLVYSLRKMASA
ncbi:MAG TPA: glycosyltransferase [Burkholderiales bacterium]|nr:glycosyltransferase [Burkholderiales bacterium]